MFKDIGLLLGSMMVSTAPCKSTLKAVLMLTRHGDRAPNGTYPNDPHSAFEWPGGIGALSPRGQQQMTQSGNIKSLRYSPLIDYKNGVVKTDNISVICSSVHRCIETAKRFLNGFLSSQNWPTDLVKVIPCNEDEGELLCFRYFPLCVRFMADGKISVASVDNKNKKILLARADSCLVLVGKPCPTYIKTLYQSASLRHPTAQEFIRARGFSNEIFKLVEKESGMPLRSLLSIFVLDDIFLVQQRNGLRLPDWVTPLYTNFIRPISEYCFASIASSKYMQIRSGVLLKDMVDRLDQYICGESNKNIVLYSAHDITISGLTYHMNVLEQCAVQPEYGSCIALELHENPQLSSDYEVKLFYFRDYKDEEPIQIVLPNMETPYSFEQFKRAMQPKFTFDYDAICNEVTGERAKI